MQIIDFQLAAIRFHASSTMMERSLPAFQKWLEDNGVCPNYDLIEFRSVDASWGVFAKEEISEGSSLGWIPYSSIISPQNTEIADLLEKEELTGGLALVIATAYERCRKQHSKWFLFLCT